MRLIELHILQSFPVSCLNRDDVGSPKSAVFGGVNRARISSQCLKRAIREFARTNLPGARFGGQRTKLIVPPLAEALQRHGIEATTSTDHATYIADKLAKLDAKATDAPQVGTLTFLAPCEIDAIAAKVAELVKTNPKAKDYEKKLSGFCKDAGLLDGADIAIFGRMAASQPDLTLEAASLFSHSLSTHQADTDLDFYAAVDDLKPASDDAGAGMLGTLEFSSAVHYRYAALNLDVLADAHHLGKLSQEDRRTVVDAFIRATLLAVPGARRSSMNANTRPSHVLGLYKASGQPVQLVNAFETPIRPRGHGLLEPSIEALRAHHASLKQTWDIACEAEVTLPEVPLETFCSSLTQHVP